MTRNGRKGFLALASLLSALLGLPGQSAAQAAPPAPPASRGTTAPSAGARPAAGPTAAAGEEASSHFKRGLKLFDEGDYTLALIEFERAYELAPNFRALYNIALVNMQLGRYSDAARTFEKYLHDGGDQIPASRLVEVKKALGELKLRTGTVDITTNVSGAEVTLDGKLLDPSGMHGPMEIDAGEHILRATAPGYGAANRTVTLAGGDHASVRLELASLVATRPTEAPAHIHAVFWPGFVASGALAAGAIVSGVVMLNARSHLSQLQGTPADPSSVSSSAEQRESAASQVNTAALAADILTGLAVVTGGVSLYLSLGPEHPGRAAAIAISPQKLSLTVPF